MYSKILVEWWKMKLLEDLSNLTQESQKRAAKWVNNAKRNGKEKGKADN